MECNVVIFDITKFTKDIERMREKNKVEYIDAIVTWCEKNKFEVEYVASIVKKDPVLKSKLQVEAENMNIIKKTATLPF